MDKTYRQVLTYSPHASGRQALERACIPGGNTWMKAVAIYEKKKWKSEKLSPVERSEFAYNDPRPKVLCKAKGSIRQNLYENNDAYTLKNAFRHHLEPWRPFSEDREQSARGRSNEDDEDSSNTKVEVAAITTARATVDGFGWHCTIEGWKVDAKGREIRAETYTTPIRDVFVSVLSWLLHPRWQQITCNMLFEYPCQSPVTSN